MQALTVVRVIDVIEDSRRCGDHALNGYNVVASA